MKKLFIFILLYVTIAFCQIKCPVCGKDMRRTFESKSENSELLYLYKCSSGHELWAPYSYEIDSKYPTDKEKLSNTTDLLSDYLKEQRTERREKQDLALELFRMKLSQDEAKFKNILNVYIDVSNKLSQFKKEEHEIENELMNLGIDYEQILKINLQSDLNTDGNIIPIQGDADSRFYLERINDILTQIIKIDKEIAILHKEKLYYNYGLRFVTLHDFLETAGEDKLISREEIENFINKFSKDDKLKKYITKDGFEIEILNNSAGFKKGLRKGLIQWQEYFY